MKLLLDTHLLLWAYDHPEKLPKAAAATLADLANKPLFSAASIWEVAIKRSRIGSSFSVDPRRLRLALLANGYLELPITSEHAITVQDLPPIHKDPFDRILIAQATVEGITLLTSDRQVAKYPGPIRKV